MPLNRCVTDARPLGATPDAYESDAEAVAASASVCPSEGITPADASRSTTAPAPSSSGAYVIETTRPRPASRR
jgi:hypothetical protein